MGPIHDGRGQQTAPEWLETLRLPAEIPPENPAPHHPPTVTQITFEPDTTTPTPTALKTLNALASALSSPELYRYFFDIAWYENPGQKSSSPEQALAPRRAASVYELLQAKPGVTPWRVMLRHARKRPDGLGAEIKPNSLTIAVTNLGG